MTCSCSSELGYPVACRQPVAGDGDRCPACVDGACDPSQTSASVDAEPHPSRVASSAQKGTPDLATPGSDNAAGVADTTGPTS